MHAQLLFDAFHVNLSAQFGFHAADSFIGDAAGYYVLEHAQIGVDVQCQAVHGHVSAAFDADSRNFTLVGHTHIEPNTDSIIYPG